MNNKIKKHKSGRKGEFIGCYAPSNVVDFIRAQAKKETRTVSNYITKVFKDLMVKENYVASFKDIKDNSENDNQEPENEFEDFEEFSEREVIKKRNSNSK